jgi:hypothetical protein
MGFGMWTRLARLPLGWRCLVKWSLLALIVLGVLYPLPHLLFHQIRHLRDWESLIQPDLAAMPEINRAIDAQLAPGHTSLEEYRAVERFVYSRIRYQFDWFNWVNLDYWPTAAEVWSRQREDCDGRAVLAASILRARGFASARIVANLNHVWVAVSDVELMGPQADRNLRKVNGRTVVTLPAWHTWLAALAQIDKFPAIRCLLILVAVLGLAYHPCRNLAGYLGLCVAGLAGYALLLDWAERQASREGSGAALTLMLAGGLLLAALAGALIAGRRAQHRWLRANAPAAGTPVGAIVPETA